MKKKYDWPRASREELANFDQKTKVCVMNCGPASGDPRSEAERMFLCGDCEKPQCAPVQLCPRCGEDAAPAMELYWPGLLDDKPIC